MKKFFVFLACLCLGTVSVFADRVITAEDFYSPWIVGIWKIDFTVTDGESIENESGFSEFTGNTPESVVRVYEKEGGDSEECTLSAFVEDFMSEFSAEASDEDIESMRLMGADVHGDFMWRINDECTLIYLSFAAAFEDEKIAFDIRMSKISQNQ